MERKEIGGGDGNKGKYIFTSTNCLSMNQIISPFVKSLIACASRPWVGEWRSPPRRCSFGFLGVDQELLRDEDAIKELTLVLASDSADLLDLGAAEGQSGIVNSIEDQLSLNVFALSDSGALAHCDKLVLLATKEILNGDASSVLGDGNIDWEMGVDQSHLVAEALHTK